MSADFSLNLSGLSLALGDYACRFDADLLNECDSTNGVLLARAAAGAPSGAVVVAAAQTAGRGRRGRVWISTPGDSLTFSLLWRFAPGTLPAGLSLAVGLAVAEALEKVGAGPSQADASPPVGGSEPGLRAWGANKVGAGPSQADASPPVTASGDFMGGSEPGLRAWGANKVGAGGTASVGTQNNSGEAIQLKWPNDLLLGGRKLGGILVELLSGAPHVAVIGIGLNLRLPAALPDDLRAQSAALDHGGDPNELLAGILVELLAVLESFSASGFADLRSAWMARHAFADVPIRLLADFAPPRMGICRGVDVDGALLLEVSGQIERVLSGEVSLRSAA
ncbi:MAG: biotin--[acetyl-CoA-carboxylase] ligase [Rhodocyclaceae bacterium]|nr:biotin--[acetyl-CoA-carboxylase] ligase [Rhodocyclaceae bacterium]